MHKTYYKGTHACLKGFEFKVLREFEKKMSNTKDVIQSAVTGHYFCKHKHAAPNNCAMECTQIVK